MMMVMMTANPDMTAIHDDRQQQQHSPGDSSRSRSGRGSSDNEKTSPRWEKLLDRKRMIESEANRRAMIVAATSAPPLSSDESCRSPVPRHSKSESGRDPLSAFSAHRRSSFRELALSPRANQKKLLEGLKEAALKAQRLKEDKSAKIIQACVRGYLVRYSMVMFTTTRKTIKKKDNLTSTNHTCKSMFSEVTMEDFDDSLASLDWSPHEEKLNISLPFEGEDADDADGCLHIRNNNNRDLVKMNKLHASTSTPETWLDSEFGSAPMMQDSFSTWLSKDHSMDSPVKRPLRTRSPTRRRTGSPLPRGADIQQRLHFSSPGGLSLYPPISPCSLADPPKQRNSNSSNKLPTFRPAPIFSPARTASSTKLVPLGRSSNNNMHELGHASFCSSMLTRDEPVRRPERCHSPIMFLR